MNKDSPGIKSAAGHLAFQSLKVHVQPHFNTDHDDKASFLFNNSTRFELYRSRNRYSLVAVSKQTVHCFLKQRLLLCCFLSLHRMSIQLKVYCNTDFYGGNCSVACTQSDTDADGHYTCDLDTGEKVCLTGYEGTDCKDNIDDCLSDPCQNGAECEDALNDFICKCKDGYTGTLCEEELDECSSNPCGNDGLCKDRVNGFICNCTDGYNGTLCDGDIDECSSNPCQNGGLCEDRVNGFICNCTDGYNGTLCNGDIDACSSNPCQNGGLCEDRVHGFICNCTDGYNGTLCDVDIDECSSNPCQVGWVCEDRVNGYICFDELCLEVDCVEGDCFEGRCFCYEGYVGDNCNLVDPCASSPCEAGTCIEFNGDFRYVYD